MKKIVIIFFTLFYLISTSGIILNNFYCCGKLKTTSIFSFHDYGKSCKGNQKPGCCDTKTVFLKIRDNQLPSTKVKVNSPDFIKIFHSTIASLFTFQYHNSETKLFALHYSPPPLISKQPIYLSVCNFRI